MNYKNLARVTDSKINDAKSSQVTVKEIEDFIDFYGPYDMVEKLEMLMDYVPKSAKSEDGDNLHELWEDDAALLKDYKDDIIKYACKRISRDDFMTLKERAGIIDSKIKDGRDDLTQKIRNVVDKEWSRLSSLEPDVENEVITVDGIDIELGTSEQYDEDQETGKALKGENYCTALHAKIGTDDIDESTWITANFESGIPKNMKPKFVKVIGKALKAANRKVSDSKIKDSTVDWDDFSKKVYRACKNIPGFFDSVEEIKEQFTEGGEYHANLTASHALDEYDYEDRDSYLDALIEEVEPALKDAKAKVEKFLPNDMECDAFVDADDIIFRIVGRE